jgi:hypothetical protein
LQDPSHPDHARTAAIIAALSAHAAPTSVHGYVTLGVRGANLPLDEIRRRVTAWKSLGVAGIFLDEAGYDYAVTRNRQNEVVRAVHDAGLRAFVNAWNPDDVFGTEVNAVTNPSGAAPLLGPADTYLLESFQIVQGTYGAAGGWTARSSRAAAYRRQYGTRIAAITTVSPSDPEFDQSKFDYAWYSCRLYGFDAFGWGEPYFSAPDSRLPYRTRPTLDIGGGSEEVVQAGDLYTRRFKEGVLEINAARHTGAFYPTYTRTR